MKIGLSMRIYEELYPSGTTEIRDALAQDWYPFLASILPHAIPLPLPNMGKNIQNFVQELALDGLILTGGNSLGTAPSRDSTEYALLSWAQQKHIPVLGICRGAQMLHHFCGGKTVFLETWHTGQSHTITLHPKMHAHTQQRIVNSYHSHGITSENFPQELQILATASDASVEAFHHKHLPWLGLMWHPERDEKLHPWDKTHIQELFGV